MTVFEAEGSIVIVDAGLAFPRDEHLGVDLILPDFSYLVERASMIRGVVLTHGHEDHVGGLPYLMREVHIPVVAATRLTLGLVKSKLDEHGLLREADLREVAPGDEPFHLGPFAIEFVRMAHSIPDAAAIVLDTPGRPRRPHGRLQARPHARRRAAHRRRRARGDRQPRRRPAARGLDERGAGGLHGVGARRRRGVPPDLPVAQGQDPRRVVRIERAPDAAGRRRRRRLRPQGRLRRALDAQELEHRPQPRLHGRAGRDDPPPERARRAAAERAADPLHRQPGRAALGDDADRVQRPPGRVRRGGRHGDHLREADPRQRAARPRRDQPAGEVRRRGAARGQRAGARLRPRPRRGAAHDPRPPAPARGHARARRVQDARRARAARARGRHPGGDGSCSPRTAASSSSRTSTARASSTTSPPA